MQTTVVCGLLGSGKTTFIKNFVKNRTEKTVVLVNDFGATGIDGEIFSASSIESVELPSGCVCCTLKVDLITTIERIICQFAPEHLVIEPSGVASPSGVLEALESAGIKAVSVVGIIDAVEFVELFDSGMYGSFFEDQVSLADVILVNKTDLASEETIAETIDRIESMNPRAVLFRTKNAAIREPLPDVSAIARRRSVGHHGHFHFNTMTIKPQRIGDLAVLTSGLGHLAQGKYGTVVRAKALVRTDQGPYRFDIVNGKMDYVPFEKDIEDSRIVIIGEGLDEERIRRRLG
ncbi:MAG: GTP-binding protein [Nitrospiraceae bacterium]|nr:GTP-binding protein [Nitrospiraceae bacterium]